MPAVRCARLPALAACALVAMMIPAPGPAAERVQLHAAGSLRAALTEAAAAFTRSSGIAVETKFGPSGVLKEAIAAGAPAEVFASANMEHPQALADAGLSDAVALFARNRLCALSRGGLDVTPVTLLDRMLDPQLKLATSTPGADPAGDYAWEVFRKAEAVRPGAFAALDKRAHKLVGAPGAAAPPANRSAYGALIADGAADIFLTYCTNAAVAQKENPGQSIVALPDELTVAADYGLTVLARAPASAYRLALFILSSPGQRILASHGFAAPMLKP
jgi:molybdate transport system substrate-binding protein